MWSGRLEKHDINSNIRATVSMEGEGKKKGEENKWDGKEKKRKRYPAGMWTHSCLVWSPYHTNKRKCVCFAIRVAAHKKPHSYRELQKWSHKQQRQKGPFFNLQKILPNKRPLVLDNVRCTNIREHIYDLQETSYLVFPRRKPWVHIAVNEYTNPITEKHTLLFIKQRSAQTLIVHH